MHGMGEARLAVEHYQLALEDIAAARVRLQGAPIAAAELQSLRGVEGACAYGLYLLLREAAPALARSTLRAHAVHGDG